MGEAPFEIAKDRPVPIWAEGVQPGPDTPIPSVLGLGPAWTNIGYGLFALSFAQLVFLIAHPFINFQTQMLNRDPLSVACLMLYLFMIIATTFWTTVDIVDRKQKFLWLLPVWVCGMASLVPIPLGFYLFVGRKIA